MRNFAYAVEYRQNEDAEWEVLNIAISRPGKVVRDLFEDLNGMPEVSRLVRVRRVLSGVELVDLLMDHECEVEEGRDKIGIDLPEA